MHPRPLGPFLHPRPLGPFLHPRPLGPVLLLLHHQKLLEPLAVDLHADLLSPVLPLLLSHQSWEHQVQVQELHLL